MMGNLDIDCCPCSKDNFEVELEIGTLIGTDATSQEKEVIPKMEEQIVVPDEDIDYLSKVTVAPIPYKEEENEAGGITIKIAEPVEG